MLHSDDYSNLPKGFWFVFAGQYVRIADAHNHAIAYSTQGFPGAYSRLVKK